VPGCIGRELYAAFTTLGLFVAALGIYDFSRSRPSHVMSFAADELRKERARRYAKINYAKDKEKE
jgi:hypothetical protein